MPGIVSNCSRYYQVISGDSCDVIASKAGITQMSTKSDENDLNFKPRLFSKQSGATIEVIDDGIVRKKGDRVTRSEEAALRLVTEHTRVPVPELYAADYFHKNRKEHGSLLMSHVNGSLLQVVWDGLDDITKERLYHEL